MGYKSPHLLAIWISANNLNPLDSTTYYFGQRPDAVPGTTATYYKAYIPKTGIITAATIHVTTNGAASNEDVAFYIRKNDTTDYAIDTALKLNGSENWLLSNYSMNVPVIQGDYVEIKMVTPAWANNPGNCKFNGTLVLETW